MAAPLPIDDVLPALTEHLAKQPNAVLTAQPGAGKTTRVPLALLNQPWLKGQRIIMLEPRRLAARTAARYMAQLLGEEVGATVGYRVRLDSKVSPATRIEVITEGILTRMIQSDPAPDGIGLVIFDEFHERSLHSDLGLALCLQAQQLLRNDLRLLVMSATLDAPALAGLLQGPVLSCLGRQYPVSTHYRPQTGGANLESGVVTAIVTALERHQGDILVFLPGAGEIRRVAAGLEGKVNNTVDIAPLYGDLPTAAQDRAILPSSPGRRKVVLATSIAETSLTVEGVGVVVDCGLMRIPRFSPRTGMTALETVPLSLAAADQRRGRAGRTGPGVCYRLWSEREEAEREPFTKPEILTADLSSLALELAAWGIRSPSELAWLDEPPAAALGQARDLLIQLGALTSDGAITAHGREMADLGFHPRLAHMVLGGGKMGHGWLGAALAVLLSSRDILPGRGPDLRLRLDGLYQGSPIIDKALHHRLIGEIRQLCRSLPTGATEKGDRELCGMVLALAYPDRIGQNRGDGRFLLSGGRGAVLKGNDLREEEYLVAPQLDDKGSESSILLAAPVTAAEIRSVLADQIETRQEIWWDHDAASVRGRRRERLGALILKEWPFTPEPHECLQALLEGIREEGLRLLPWDKKTNQWRQRVVFLHHYDPASWPDLSDQALLANLEEWLQPYLYGLTGAQDLQRLTLQPIVESLLNRQQRDELERFAPTHLGVPSGQRIAVDYSEPSAPVLAVRLQEVFGWSDTPRLAGGRVPLTLHLLSPSRRPVQVTRDLASFWRTTYFAVRKELAGRYPRHYWPDDPLTAQATHKAKPKGTKP